MRRAKLTIEQAENGSEAYWTRLTARNNEILDVSEMTYHRAVAKRMRAARIRAYIDVLESEGYVVTKAEEAGR